MRLWCLLMGLCSPAAAETLVARTPVAIEAMGGYCDAPAATIAPGADGKEVEHQDHYFDYVVPGDVLVAQPRMGIGVRVKIRGYGPGQSARVQIIPPGKERQFWDYDIGQSGVIEFGYLPRVGGTLSEGRYLFSVLDEEGVIFTAAITLDGTSATGFCIPEVS